MSQEAAERLLGRLVTDGQFRRLAADLPEKTCLPAGYRLTASELKLLSGLKMPRVTELAGRLGPGLCRAGSKMVRPEGGWDGSRALLTTEYFLSVYNILKPLHSPYP